MNKSSCFTPYCPRKFTPSITYPIIITKELTLTPPHLPLLKATNWPLSRMLPGVVNLLAQSIMALLCNSSRLILSLVFSFSALALTLLENLSARIKPPWDLANPRSWQQMNAQQNSSPLNIFPTTWELRRLTIGRKYATVIKSPGSRPPQLHQKVSNT